MKYYWLLLSLSLFGTSCLCQSHSDSANAKGIVVPLNREGTANIRFITLLQAWARFVDLNPGSIYKEKPRKSYSDFALRRLVFTSVAQLHPRTLLVLNVSGSAGSGDVPFQSGLNVSILDAYGEYKFSDALYIGAGLHQWTGFSRLNEDGVGSLINLDQPAFQQITFNRVDRIGRFLGVYAKGMVGRLHYRVSVNDGFVPSATNVAANTGKGSPGGGAVQTEAKSALLNVAYFNPSAVSKIFQGYTSYAFWEKEDHTTPYEVSSYQGSKKIFNIGAGFIYRKAGMLTPTFIELRDASLPESNTNQKLLKSATENDVVAYAADAILLYPFNKNLEGIALYTGYFHTNLGPNYYTVTSVLNPSVATTGASPINGAGNGFPAAGTGNTFYTQAGYIAPKQWLGNARIGVFGTYQHSGFEALKEAVKVYEAGLTLFINGNKVKLTAQYRDRPMYSGNAAYADKPSTAIVAGRKSEIITQFQLNF